MMDTAKVVPATEPQPGLRVLVLDEEFPYPPNSGKRIRTWNLLRRLAVSHSLHLICFGELSPDDEAVARRFNIEVTTAGRLAPDRGATLVWRLLRNLFSSLPYSVQKHFKEDFQQRVDAQIETFRPSIIHCEWGPYASYLRDLRGLPCVVAAHNVESQIWSRRASVAGNPLSQWFFRSQARRMERFERNFAPRVSAVVTVSEGDAKIFATWGAKAVIVDNGVDLEQYALSQQLEVSGRILFLASMDWFPNIDALDFYLREIHPLVRRGPETTLRIVGRRLSSSDAERFRSFAGVEVVGEVEDVQAELANAAVIVVPLRIGGGSRLKILEALAAGKAVVSTTVGAEGLAVQDSLHLRIADTPNDFAEAVHSLLSDPAARRVLGTNGRRLVEQKYGWDALSQGLEAAWKDAAKARASQ